MWETDVYDPLRRGASAPIKPNEDTPALLQRPGSGATDSAQRAETPCACCQLAFSEMRTSAVAAPEARELESARTRPQPQPEGNEHAPSVGNPLA
jgi:hypothetical protein